jgi:hypothetical protein
MNITPLTLTLTLTPLNITLHRATQREGGGAHSRCDVKDRIEILFEILVSC